jgi:hypothetical protein
MLKPSHHELLWHLHCCAYPQESDWAPVFDAISNDGLRVDAKIPPINSTLMHMAICGMCALWQLRRFGVHGAAARVSRGGLCARSAATLQ